MIYFIRAEGTDFVKIGTCASDVNGRLTSCQTGNPNLLILEAVIPGSYPEEKKLHDRWRDLQNILRSQFIPFTSNMAIAGDPGEPDVIATAPEDEE